MIGEAAVIGKNELHTSARKPGSVSSSVWTAPPGRAVASRTSTCQPASARRFAATRPLCPAPITTASTASVLTQASWSQVRACGSGIVARTPSPSGLPVPCLRKPVSTTTIADRVTPKLVGALGDRADLFGEAAAEMLLRRRQRREQRRGIVAAQRVTDAVRALLPFTVQPVRRTHLTREFPQRRRVLPRPGGDRAIARSPSPLRVDAGLPGGFTGGGRLEAQVAAFGGLPAGDAAGGCEHRPARAARPGRGGQCGRPRAELRTQKAQCGQRVPQPRTVRRAHARGRDHLADFAQRADRIVGHSFVILSTTSHLSSLR